MAHATNAAEFWAAHLSAIDQCGVSVTEYAREHNLSAPSLYGWRNRLRNASATEQRLHFSEVVVTQSAVPSRVLLRIGDALLEFEQLPDAVWLAEFLSTVSAGRSR